MHELFAAVKEAAREACQYVSQVARQLDRLRETRDYNEVIRGIYLLKNTNTFNYYYWIESLDVAATVTL